MENLYERFTDRARKVLHIANAEAQRFNHEYIGTEHILLGLIKEGSGVAAKVLKNFDVDLRKARLQVEMLVISGPDMVTMGKLPLTPRMKKVLEYAAEESKALNDNYIGTEHLLLGLIRERDGIAVKVLMKLGVQLDEVRNEVINLLGGVTIFPKEVMKKGLVASRIESSESALRELVAALSVYGTVDQIKHAAFLIEEIGALRTECKNCV